MSEKKIVPTFREEKDDAELGELIELKHLVQDEVNRRKCRRRTAFDPTEYDDISEAIRDAPPEYGINRIRREFNGEELNWGDAE